MTALSEMIRIIGKKTKCKYSRKTFRAILNQGKDFRHLIDLNMSLARWCSAIPIRGTASDVVGIDSATKFKNTVNDSRIVTPAKWFSPDFRVLHIFGFHFVFALIK